MLLMALSGAALRAETIYWYSVSGGNNLTSTGAPMSGGFRFELGVFKGSFVPTDANTADWVANWVPAQRVNYNATNQLFSGQFTVVNNLAPFTVGKAAYVWGFQGGVASSEWVLFRKSNWTWPRPNPLNPFGVVWDAKDATAVLGAIDADGVPFLMQSAEVTATASPATSWAQWREVELAGESLDGPGDDPDRDGTVNLLEFVFGLPPLQAGAGPLTPVEIVERTGERYLQMTIPRRMDHPATLTVQVGPDLINWTSGATATTVVLDTPSGLVVRDLTPLGPGTPRRFMRLLAALESP